MSRHDRILFAGDPHGNFKPLIAAVHKHQPEAVVLLGDYDLDMPLHRCLQEIIGLTQIWWIAGNHDFETPDKFNNLFYSELADNSLHLKVAEIAGLKIAGLGGIFLGRVWYPPQPHKWQNKQHYLHHQPTHIKNSGLPLKYQSAIWPDEFEALKKLKADILVSHEAPGSHRHGFSVIGDLAAAMGVKHIFHGHLHENYVRTIKNNIHVFGVANMAVADLHGKTLNDQ
ncbi:MAG: metallophosphoesterase [Methylovulum sp.]|nr:metallophosphoesterase [Methylovulum sp.]